MSVAWATVETSLGDLMVQLFADFTALYGDEDLAAVATAATVNELIADGLLTVGSESDATPEA